METVRMALLYIYKELKKSSIKKRKFVLNDACYHAAIDFLRKSVYSC